MFRGVVIIAFVVSGLWQTSKAAKTCAVARVRHPFADRK
jgi:hypothetical protein